MITNKKNKTMNSEQFFNAIDEINCIAGDFIPVSVNNTTISLDKYELLKLLQNRYIDARRDEFKKWLKDSTIKSQDIADELGISAIQFSQLLNGFTKSNKTTGSTIEFITKCEKIAHELC